MVYLPKSQYQIKESLGDYVYVDDNSIYIGKYIELDNGVLLAGSNLSKAYRVLAPIDGDESLNSKKQVVYKGVFNINNPNTFEFHSKVNKVISRKPYPTSEDYKKGKFMRYFTYRLNSPSHMFEIDEETYNKLLGESEEYDFNLYGIGSIEWDLTENSTRSNAVIIDRQIETNPYLKLLFSNLQEYYIPSNNKRKLIDRSKPNKRSHSKAKIESQISKKTENKEKRRKARILKKSINKKESSKIPTYKGSTSSTEGRSSGGGGGGY